MKHMCDYGCGQEAKYQFKNGKWCCSKHYRSCLAQRKKYSGENNPFFGKDHSEKVKKQISKKRTGSYHSEEWKKEHSKKMTGKRWTEEAKEKRRIPFEEVSKSFELVGYKLLSKREEYKGGFSKLEVICPEGHKYYVTWNGFKAGDRCRECANFKQRTSFSEIKELFEKNKYKIFTNLEDFEKYFPKKVKVMCPKGHIYDCNWLEFKRGTRCKKCFSKILSEKLKITFEEKRDFIDHEGFELLTSKEEYIISPDKELKIKCPKGHIFKMLWYNFRGGSRCWQCFCERQKERMLNGFAGYMLSQVKNPSKPQKELYEKTKEIYPEAILEYQVLNYSIDIVIPNLRIAIEYDGSYWHQDQEADNKRQKEIENEGWTFLRYVDYVPSKEELERDIFLKIQ